MKTKFGYFQMHTQNYAVCKVMLMKEKFDAKRMI